jgi:putative copper resistance protein D
VDFGRARRGAALLADGIRRGCAPCRTGAINTLVLVGSAEALADTPYGRLLSFVLFSVMVVLALINRFRLLARLRREPPSSAPIGALARSVLFEQALGFAVLAVVSVLGTWPPAIHHHSG